MTSETRAATPWLLGRARSFQFAFRGLGLLFREPNSKIHAAATAAVFAAGLVARLTSIEWALLALTVGFVWVAEAVNTSMELLANAAVPNRHPLVGAAKDVSACAVLVAAISAVVVGAFVFLPRILHG
jgi:diacylglycerol kinase (ATP)